MTYRRSLLTAAVLAALLIGSAAPTVAEPWPVRSLPIISAAAPGLTKVGPFTAQPTKQVSLGRYVTWRFVTDPILAWQRLTIEVAEKGSDGTWSAFHEVTKVVIDDTGQAFYAMASSTPRLVSIRAVFPAAGSLTTVDSRSTGVQARWMASPPRPVSLTSSSAVAGSTTFTTSTKVAALGQTVTWRWTGPSTIDGHFAAVWVAERASSGLWGPFRPDVGETIEFDSHGVATYSVHFETPTWIAVRIHLPVGSPPVPETWSVPVQARWR